MALSLWETIKHYFMGTDLIPKQGEPVATNPLLRYFWLLVLWVGFPAYLYYLFQDVNVERFLKAMGAIVSLVFVYYIAVYLVWMYSGTKIVTLRYILGSLIGFSGFIYVGLLLFLAKRGRYHNEEIGGRRKRH